MAIDKDPNIIRELKALSDLEHYKNLLSILSYHDFWSSDEQNFYLQMYVKWIVQKMDFDDLPELWLRRQRKLIDAIFHQ